MSVALLNQIVHSQPHHHGGSHWTYADINAWPRNHCYNNNTEQSPIDIPIALTAKCSGSKD